MFKKKTKNTSFVYYFQGIPGSGKTTLARYIRNKLRDMKVPCALVDDEVWMHMTLEHRLEFLNMLREDYQIIIITSVTPPHPEYPVDKCVLVEEDEDVAKKRHYDVERFGEDAKKDPQWKEYERWWKPWREYTRKNGASFLVESKTVKGRYHEFYEDVLAHDLARLP